MIHYINDCVNKSSEAQAEGSHLKNFVNKIIGQPASYSHKQNYTFGKTLGAGSFGIVRYARNNVTGEDVAMKIILKKALKGNEAMVLEEIKLLEELHNPTLLDLEIGLKVKISFILQHNWPPVVNYLIELCNKVDSLNMMLRWL